ncbi:hypothetical protein [Rhodoplanes roseus]|uniref:Uncharacterized protein n=1 Tax=Rhodoplanes roseus TaxID=29409 RepID=A0A327KH70_9BRAD|nr:hypothetical protein [Rhodoplanes roseus]RAI36983.1 hypothetical protein CH341_29980 [Rhodoplanes roseus]
MTSPSIHHYGFDDARHPRFPRWRAALVAQLVATGALVVSIAVLIMAVTLQIAEAASLDPASGSGGGLPIAGLVSLGLVAVGGLTVLITGVGAQLRSRD